MSDNTLNFGKEIIELLEEKGYGIDAGLGNSIILKVAEAFETGKEQGIKKGIKQACREMEIKISTIRSKTE